MLAQKASNLFSDATSSRQLLVTVRLYYNIDIYPERYLIRVDFSLEFSLSTELVKEGVKLDQESATHLVKDISDSNSGSCLRLKDNFL